MDHRREEELIVIKVDLRGLRLGESAFALYERHGDGPSSLFGFAEIAIRDYAGADNAICTIFDSERRPLAAVAVTVSDASPASFARAIKNVMVGQYPDQAVIVE